MIATAILIGALAALLLWVHFATPPVPLHSPMGILLLAIVVVIILSVVGVLFNLIGGSLI